MKKNFLLNLLIIFLGHVQNQEDLPSTEINNTVRNWSYIPADPKIVGGVKAKIGERKYIVSIRLKMREKSFGEGHRCGGSLITSKRVLSAAHCFLVNSRATAKMYSANQIKIVMGTLKLYSKSSTTLEFLNIKYTYHSKYNCKTMENDIAFVTLDGLVSNKPNIKPIKLADSYVEVGALCAVSGWGYTEFRKKMYSNDLLTASIYFLNQGLCKSNYAGEMLPGMLCAGDWTGEKDACLGDSGGPLVCNDSQVGVVSFGVECGIKDFPGVYSDVVFYRSWILGQEDKKLYRNDATPIRNIGVPRDRTYESNISRILGGIPVTLEEHKYMVSVRIKEKDNYFGKGHICGGSLITSEKILTAAHCFIESISVGKMMSAKHLKVVMGTLDRFLKTSTTVECLDVKYTCHANFNMKTFENDIAVMIFNGRIDNNPNIEPIDITTIQPEVGTMCTISGWGYTDDNYKGTTGILIKASIDIFDQSRCIFTFGERMQPGMLCAGEGRGFKDICFGDSGGPLVCNNRVSGIVSLRVKCGTPNYPGIYTNVASYRSWLLEVTGRSSFTNVADFKEIKTFSIIIVSFILSSRGLQQ